MKKNLLAAALSAFTISLLADQSSLTNAYVQHNLVSDIPGLADQTDPNLVNPWGIAFNATGPFWISDNHSGLSTLYEGNGAVQSLVVSIPPPDGGNPPGAPTGIVFNGSTNFLVAPGQPARFIYATEDGTITAWNSGTNSVLKADNSASGAVYKGLAIGASTGSNFLYAANFYAGTIDVFDASFNRVTLPGAFSDPDIPAGFAPFNIQNIGGNLYVTYAKQDEFGHDDVSGPGNGYVDVYDTSGGLVKRFVSQTVLNSPWGLALAPKDFGAFGGALLIGNFGDGKINAFDPKTGNFLGSLAGLSGNSISIDGLWALAFGNDWRAGDSHILYFTAGIAGSGAVEDHGLFGSLTAAIPAITSVSNRQIALNVSWAGGAAPFLLQKKTSLAGDWWNILTTSNRSVSVAEDGQKGFFRVLDQSQATVMPYTVWLSGDNCVPPVTTPGTGVGTLSIEGNKLTYNISYSGLSSPATLAHIHGPADATGNAGVLIPFPNPSGTSGTISGSADLTPSQLQSITNGLTYANIHTVAHPGGEIRGQVVPLQFFATLNGASEVPSVTTSATGTAVLTLVGNQVFYKVRYTGLSAAATLSHIHGPADTNHSAGVLVPFTNPTGTTGEISGVATLSPTMLVDLLSGFTYINVHSSAHPSGEIRGQVTR